MFQFPGFALLSLCIQPKSTWFNVIKITKAIYMMLSGGLPHSEIQGSKPILGSPWLIAEYHVLHRLLLPRHPPNALLALDLIQKKQDFRLPAPGWFDQRLFFRSEVVHFPHTSEEECCLVSVLDLDKIAVSWPVT